MTNTQAFQKRSHLDHRAGEVFACHTTPGALERLTPPWSGVAVESLEADLWSFVGDRSLASRLRKMSDDSASTDLSDTISKRRRKRGFRFAGSTISCACVQATGMVHDHSMDCFRRRELAAA